MFEVTNGNEIEKELSRIYKDFNNHFYNGDLPDVMITFKPTKGRYGHVSTTTVWKSDTETLESKYELNISAYTINESPRAVCETILHEQAHLYNIIHGIKDCSNNGRYHNKKFKKTAEDHGLICNQVNDLYGWSFTSFDDKALKYFQKLNIKNFEYYFAKTAKPGNLMRYACPICQKTVAWVSSEQYLLCGNCSERLIYAPKKQKKKV